MQLSIPSGWDAVTPEWMTSALAGAFPGVEVQDVNVELRDDGTNRRARLGLRYARGSGPATVFVKAADPDHAAVNARMGGVFNEPRLFASGVPLPLDHPQVYFTLIDEPHLDFIMVMEDVRARGGDPRDATRPMTVEQVANGVRDLAKLHSAFWGDRLRDYEQLSWVEPFVSWRGMAVGIDIGLERAGDGVPPGVQRMTGKDVMRDLWAPFIATLAQGGQTLLHGDPHIGNTYVLPDDRVGFLDWQVLRTGNSSIDLGYFVQGACTVEDRRAAERGLVAEYHAALEVPAGELPPYEDVWRRYRASTAHGLTMWLVTAASDWQRLEVSLTLAHRYAAAFTDLDGAAAIKDLTRAGAAE
jgi:aminoglycoside phosphotransferase (APT) family kinase protein